MCSLSAVASFAVDCVGVICGVIDVFGKIETDLLIRSRLRLFEHSTIIRNGKIQYWLLHKEYSSTKNIPPPSQNDFLPRLVEKNLAEYVRKLTSSTLPQLTTTSLTTKETS